jgi:hypothetical protein
VSRPPMTRDAAIARFWARVAKGEPDECWEWQGARGSFGYGNVNFQGRHVNTHRLAVELTSGPIPGGLLVLHACDNPPCCNPAHLSVGDHFANMADMVAKGRHGRWNRQGPHGNAKLTPRQVREIRRRYAAHEHRPGRPGHRVPDSTRALAAEFGVTPSNIRWIVQRRTWKEVAA